MSILKKTIIFAILIIATLFIACTIVLSIAGGDLLFIGYNSFFIAPSYNKTESFLKTNINVLSHLASELFDLDYDSITIRRESIGGEDGYDMRVQSEYLVYETIPVPNELFEHIETLFESGIQVISCGRNSINFTMWSTMDESRGIIYSRTGTKPNGEQLVEVKQLSYNNWYYYVHNYEKAKEQNPERFK